MSSVLWSFASSRSRELSIEDAGRSLIAPRHCFDITDSTALSVHPTHVTHGGGCRRGLSRRRGRAAARVGEVNELGTIRAGSCLRRGDGQVTVRNPATPGARRRYRDCLLAVPHPEAARLLRKADRDRTGHGDGSRNWPRRQCCPNRRTRACWGTCTPCE